jgi:hypothetical protein
VHPERHLELVRSRLKVVLRGLQILPPFRKRGPDGPAPVPEGRDWIEQPIEGQRRFEGRGLGRAIDRGQLNGGPKASGRSRRDAILVPPPEA